MILEVFFNPNDSMILGTEQRNWLKEIAYGPGYKKHTTKLCTRKPNCLLKCTLYFQPRDCSVLPFSLRLLSLSIGRPISKTYGNTQQTTWFHLSLRYGTQQGSINNRDPEDQHLIQQCFKVDLWERLGGWPCLQPSFPGPKYFYSMNIQPSQLVAQPKNATHLFCSSATAAHSKWQLQQ